MRKSMSPWRFGLLLAAGIALLGSAGCNKDAPDPAISAPAAPAASTTVITPTPTVIVREVAKPTKGKRAKAPPRNAKPSNAVRFDQRVKWKSNPKSKAVFAVDDGLVWLVDPDSGWPYTIDRSGVVYTADAETGEVYSLGPLSDWEGDAPYFFGYWDYDDGAYVFEDYEAYEALYVDQAVEEYAYEQAYDEVWEYEDYFESEEFAASTIEWEAAELEAEAIANEEYELAKGEAELADAEAAVAEANAAEYDTSDAKALAADQAQVGADDALEAAERDAEAADAEAAEAEAEAAAAEAHEAAANEVDGDDGGEIDASDEGDDSGDDAGVEGDEE